MSLEVLTMILRTPEGKIVQMAVQATEAKEVHIPEGLSGPFNFNFGMPDSKGQHNFHARLMMNKNDWMIAFRVMPFVATVEKEMAPKLILEAIAEHYIKEETYILGLDIAKTYKDCEWAVIVCKGATLNAFLSNKDGSQFYCFPFYNFYENAHVCTGSLVLNGNAWNDIQAVLGARTTPHRTWTAGRYHNGMSFRVKEGRIIEDKGIIIKPAPMDLPEFQKDVRALLNNQVFGNITP